MSLEKVRDILKDADRHHSSVIAYDAFDYNTISSAIEGAARVRRPVIVMLYPSMDKHIPRVRRAGKDPGGAASGSLQRL